MSQVAERPSVTSSLLFPLLADSAKPDCLLSLVSRPKPLGGLPAVSPCPLPSPGVLRASSLAAGSWALFPCWHQGLESLFLPYLLTLVTIPPLPRSAGCSELSAFRLPTESVRAHLRTVLCLFSWTVLLEPRLVAHSLSQQNAQSPSSITFLEMGCSSDLATH